jgi:hypothetical protein
MKKSLAPILILAMAIGLFYCSPNETEIEKEDERKQMGITPAQMKILGITKIVTYAANDPGYAEATKDIKEMIRKSRSSQKNGARTHEGDPIPQSVVEIENGYYSEVWSGSSVVKFLQTHENGYFVMMSLYAPNDRQYKLWLGPQNVPGEPVLGYEVFDPWNGTLLGSSKRQPGFGGWWDCVLGEFRRFCMATPISELLCAAAGGACPECMLTVYAAWMLSCAW